MTQLVVTLENGADFSLLSRMIENLKGVLNVSLPIQKGDEATDSTKDWIKKMNELSGCVDSSMIDMSDERTQYIMSK